MIKNENKDLKVEIAIRLSKLQSKKQKLEILQKLKESLKIKTAIKIKKLENVQNNHQKMTEKLLTKTLRILPTVILKMRTTEVINKYDGDFLSSILKIDPVRKYQDSVSTNCSDENLQPNLVHEFLEKMRENELSKSVKKIKRIVGAKKRRLRNGVKGNFA
jgi:hypothetical protein